MQDQAGFTHTMAAHPSEVLPGTLFSLRSDGLPDTVSMPARILNFFVACILSGLQTYAGQPLDVILTSTQAKRSRILAQYSSGYPMAAQAEEDQLSMQLLDNFRQSDSNTAPPAMETENQLPPPVRHVVHCLRSVMLTVKLASFIPISTNSAEIACSVVFQVIMGLKDDLALALLSLAAYTEEATTAAPDLQQVPPSSSAAEASAKRDICNWSQMAIGLLLPILRWAVKELGNPFAAALPVCCLAALSSLSLIELLLYEGQLQARRAVGQAMFTAGAHSVYTWEILMTGCTLSSCSIRVHTSNQLSLHACVPCLQLMHTSFCQVYIWAYICPRVQCQVFWLSVACVGLTCKACILVGQLMLRTLWHSTCHLLGSESPLACSATVLNKFYSHYPGVLWHVGGIPLLLKVVGTPRLEDQYVYQPLPIGLAAQACRCLEVLIEQDVSRRALTARMKGVTHLSQQLGHEICKAVDNPGTAVVLSL